MKKIIFTFSLSFAAIFSFAGTIVVQNTNDSGSGSLRDGISSAISGDTIRFNPNLISSGSNTILLNSELNFVKNLVFKGLYNATDTLYISGNNSHRIFYVDFSGSTILNKTITLDSMAIVDGQATGNGGAIYFKHGDSLVVNHSLIVRNTASSAGGAIYSYAFSSVSQSSIVSINNSIISENTASTAGGGIYSYSNSNNNFSVVTINNSTIAGNTAGSSSGGGVYSYTNSNTSNYSTITVNNSTISGNSAVSGWGGGIYSYSNSNAANAASTLTINNSSIVGNISHSAGGGGIYSRSKIVDYNSNATSYSTVTATNSNISNNLIGGGIHSISSSSDYYSTTAGSTVTVRNCTLSGNTATNAGGAISSISSAAYTGFSISSTITIDSSNITGNTAGAAGGGIHSQSSSHSTVNVNKSTIAENSSAYYGGGGIYSKSVYTSTVTINKSTIAKNTATDNGGGIYSYADLAAYSSGSFSSITLNESTVFENTAANDGGGIYSKCYFNVSEVLVNNSTIYGNAGTVGGGIYSQSPTSRIWPKSSIVAINGTSNIHNNSANTIASLGYNIFSDAPNGYDNSNDQINIDSITLDLLPLANNGGATQTMLPGAASIAINSGNPLDSSAAQNAAIVGIRDVGAAESGTTIMVGLDKNKEEKSLYTLYPNPTTDYLNIHFPNKEIGQKLTFAIVDMQGRILYHHQALTNADKTYQLPVSDFTAGLYLLEIRKDDLLLGSALFIKK